MNTIAQEEFVLSTMKLLSGRGWVQDPERPILFYFSLKGPYRSEVYFSKPRILGQEIELYTLVNSIFGCTDAITHHFWRFNFKRRKYEFWVASQSSAWRDRKFKTYAQFYGHLREKIIEAET